MSQDHLHAHLEFFAELGVGGLRREPEWRTRAQREPSEPTGPGEPGEPPEPVPMPDEKEPPPSEPPQQDPPRPDQPETIKVYASQD